MCSQASFFLMIIMCSHAATAVTNVFDNGTYTTQLCWVESSSYKQSDNRIDRCGFLRSVPPPKPLLMATPIEAGEFSVLLFLHGYLLDNSFYSQLIQHVASHGFIVIAPQLYRWAGPDTSDEIHSAAAITNWLSKGLCKVLPPNVRPNFGKLALAGHSRGGKTAFALALRKLNITTDLKFSALIGVDPVDGMNTGKHTFPPVLTGVPHSFDLDMATMVIGSGFGEERTWIPFSPPCAPKGVNHENFFNECNKPAWYFVAERYGHLDMLNDDMGPVGILANFLCKHGHSRKPMRRFVGGVMVAFLKAYLYGDYGDLLAITDGHVSVPVEFKCDCFVRKPENIGHKRRACECTGGVQM